MKGIYSSSAAEYFIWNGWRYFCLGIDSYEQFYYWVMAKYIDKDVLVAEIKNKKKYAQTLGDNAINSSMQQFYDGMKQGCVDILSFLNTLEMKDVDLDAELEHYKEEQNIRYEEDINMFEFAKHFFELGLKTKQITIWNVNNLYYNIFY